MECNKSRALNLPSHLNKMRNQRRKSKAACPQPPQWNRTRQLENDTLSTNYNVQSNVARTLFHSEIIIHYSTQKNTIRRYRLKQITNCTAIRHKNCRRMPPFWLGRRKEYMRMRNMRRHLKPPYCCCPNVEKLPPSWVAVEEDKPDRPIPDPAPMACAMYHAVAGPFSFSSEAPPTPPIIPMSARFVFFAAQWRSTWYHRKATKHK